MGLYRIRSSWVAGLTATVLLSAQLAGAALIVGPEQLIQAGGSVIEVPGYSVPSYADWNNDGLNDLVVGEGSGSEMPRVRVYLNEGTAAEPQFSGYFYAQYTAGGGLTAVGGGSLGVFPRLVYWDDDALQDLLVGLADGTVGIFLNSGTGANPTFQPATGVQVGMFPPLPLNNR